MIKIIRISPQGWFDLGKEQGILSFWNFWLKCFPRANVIMQCPGMKIKASFRTEKLLSPPHFSENYRMNKILLRYFFFLQILYIFCNSPVGRCPEGAKKAASVCIGWIGAELLNWMATTWPGSKRGGNEGDPDYQLIVSPPCYHIPVTW